jgi:hypothetical protein
MINISRVLYELGVDEWVLRGTPTSEVEFNEMFRKIIGRDDIGTAIESDNPNDFGVTWDQIVTKQAELQADYDSKQYQRDRASQYPSIQDQLDMQYHDQVNGTTTWKDTVAKVKSDNPKPT